MNFLELFTYLCFRQNIGELSETVKDDLVRFLGEEKSTQFLLVYSYMLQLDNINKTLAVSEKNLVDFYKLLETVKHIGE